MSGGDEFPWELRLEEFTGGGGYRGRVNELPGCEVELPGATFSEAFEALRNKVAEWVGRAEQEGIPLPPPEDEKTLDEPLAEGAFTLSNLVGITEKMSVGDLRQHHGHVPDDTVVLLIVPPDMARVDLPAPYNVLPVAYNVSLDPYKGGPVVVIRAVDTDDDAG